MNLENVIRESLMNGFAPELMLEALSRDNSEMKLQLAPGGHAGIFLVLKYGLGKIKGKCTVSTQGRVMEKSCNCEDGTSGFDCVHMVMALLALVTDDDDELEVDYEDWLRELPKTRKLGTSIALSTDGVYHMLDYRKMTQRMDNWIARMTVVNETELLVDISREERAQFWSRSTYLVPVEKIDVVLNKEKEQFEFNCRCKQKRKPFCQHEIFALESRESHFCLQNDL